MPYRVAPAPPPKIPAGPDHIGAAMRIARRNRRIGLAFALAMAAGVVTTMMMQSAARGRHQAALQAAQVDLEACLLGPEPMAGGLASMGASCRLRVRRRQLVVMTTPVERRIDDGLTGWPMRCSDAARRIMREAIQLGDERLQDDANGDRSKLATMKAMSEPVGVLLCLDAMGRGRAPHLSTAAAASFPGLATPLDIDGLFAHGPPSLEATKAKALDDSARLAGLMPAGYREVGSTSKDDGPPKLPDGDSMMLDRDWPGVIHTAHCEAGKCQKRIVSRETFDLNDPTLRATDAERFGAARIGDARGPIIAVWRAGTRGGLRIRVAPIDRLAATSDIVVFDDLVRDGVMQDSSTLDAFRVYGGTREARIFLVTSKGTWIVAVNEAGAFTLR